MEWQPVIELRVFILCILLFIILFPWSLHLGVLYSVESTQFYIDCISLFLLTISFFSFLFYWQYYEGVVHAGKLLFSYMSSKISMIVWIQFRSSYGIVFICLYCLFTIITMNRKRKCALATRETTLMMKAIRESGCILLTLKLL